MHTASYVWAKIVNDLERQLTEEAVAAWLEDAQVVDLTEEALILYSPTEYRRERIRTSCRSYIEDSLKRLFHLQVRLEVWGEVERKAAQIAESPRGSRFSLENFIAGTANALPLKIATVVAAEPGGEVFNPVFFYGPPGVGKTHLLCAIANGIAEKYPQKKLVCIKGDQFTNELVAAIRTGTTGDFREKYRRADVLLVDDIQFIAGKESTQEEFFHTFNALYESGKQIVLTADRKPCDMVTLEDRLRSRFGAGVSVAVSPPDPETRVRITRAKAKSLGLDLGPEAVAYIAESLPENVRQIEGALKKIRAFRDLADLDLSLESIRRTVEDMRIARENPRVTPGLILRNVCGYYGLTEDVLKGPQRSRNVSEPRQLAMYLMRQMLNMSQDDIAKVFSRERTTVLHALKQVEKTLQIKGNSLEPVLEDLRGCIFSGP